MRLNELPPRLQKKVRAALAASAPDMESFIKRGPPKSNPHKTYGPLCSIHVYSVRKRLADPDGISAKACIDGLVQERILQDDSAKHVKEVRYSQEQGEPEQTVITIEWG